MPARKKIKKVTKKKVAKKIVARKAKVLKKKTVKKKVAKRKAVVNKKTSKKKSPNAKVVKKKAATKTVAKKVAKKKPVKKAAIKNKAPVKKAAVKNKAPVKKAAVKNKAPVKKAAVKKPVKKLAARAPKKRINYNDFSEQEKTNTVAGPLEFTPYQLVAKEDYMSDQQLKHFAQILVSWRKQLMSEVDTTKGHLRHDGEAYADPLDRAAQEEGFNLELRTRDRERKLIKKIEQALDWVDQGVYGYCEECGSEIGVKRLEARPTAAKCIDCKTFSEIREKQIGKG